jgi:hypothetical protein
MRIIINNLLATIKMQKIINVLALASTAVSVAVVGTGVYVYVNKDAIIESVTEKALGGLGGLGGSLGGDLPVGTPDLAPPAGQASLPDTPTTPNF